MNIYFVGSLKTPFIKRDYELLKGNNTVVAFDLSQYNYRFGFLLEYFLFLFQWKHVKDSVIVWVWFADYLVLPFVILAKVFRKPIIVNVGGWEVMNYPELQYGNQRNWLRGFVSRWIIYNANINIVPSPAYREIVKVLVPSARIVVISGFLDEKVCEESLPEKKDIVVTACCSLQSFIFKGIPTFLEIKKNAPFKMKVIYQVPRREYIAILKESKVYCQLSYAEPFGTSLLEAMAYGCIPVVVGAGGLPYVVGDVGYIVPWGDVVRIRDAIDKALKATLLDMQKVRDRAGYFSIDRNRQQIKELLARY